MSAADRTPLAVFIDTNVFLSFFHYTSDALDDLEKLVDTAKGGAIQLLLPEQVIDEFVRDREVKLADTLKRIGESKTGGQYPHAFREDPEYQELRALESQFIQVRSRVVARFERTAQAGNLKADRVITSLFDVSVHLPVDAPLLQAAELRRRRGNPPGKRETLGDQINWECLLAHAPTGELCIISADRDWRAPLDENRVHPFLAAEWSSTMGAGDVHLYRDLRTFVSDQLPEVSIRFEAVDIASEEAAERQHLIAALRDSPNFQTTHSLVRELTQYTDFSADELNEILLASTTNDQISWIINDPDVAVFIKRLLEGREREADPELMSEVHRLMDEGTGA
jgi:predicted nucleic acid-binding protein